MINKRQAMEVLNAGLRTGADFAEIFLEDTVATGASVENGKVDAASINKQFGAGIRLLRELRSVYGYTNDVSTKGLLRLASSLADSFKGERTLTVTEIKNVPTRKIHRRRIPLSTVPLEEKIAYLKKGETAMHGDPRIVRTRAQFSSDCSSITIYNSKGHCHKDKRERGRLVLLAVASDGQRIETAVEGPGTCAGFEYFLEKIDVVKLGQGVARSAIDKLSAAECPSGRMTVVIGNGVGGVIFHEACGHALEATSVARKLSVFSDSLGKKIASDIVTAVDDGSIPGAWGADAIDDEGNKTRRNVLIKNGVCTSFLVDDCNGRRMGMEGNGACRRESYMYEPTSRMSNTFIVNGHSTPEEIIKATKLGLYAAKLGGGQVDPTTGEFNFGCDEAYIIRDGKICEQVRDASLVGSAKEILFNIDMVGNDCDRSQGVCGSLSGGVPVDVGQPTIRVKNITVGGRGGALQ